MSNGDPIGAHLPKGKSNAARKGRYDGSYTGTEQRIKDRLMKQFCRDEGPPPSNAYLESPCWCACGRLKAEGKQQCARCLGMDAKAPQLGDCDSDIRAAIAEARCIHPPAAEEWTREELLARVMGQLRRQNIDPRRVLELIDAH